MKSVGQIFILCILKSITAIFFLNWVTIPTPVLAQMQESFSDGNFTADPPWSGSADDFVVRDGTLWLSADPSAGSAFLTTPSEVAYGSWQFRVHLGFNPSASNFARVYLMSTSPDLDMEPEGYFVIIGGTNDDVSLYYRNESSTVKIINGTDGRADATSVTLVVKVSRSPSGEWQLMTRTETESDFHVEGTASHSAGESGSFFGFECVFTSTRADKFSFDDISISTELEEQDDDVPPTVANVETVDAPTIRVTYSETVDPSGAVNVSNYLISNDVGNPSQIVLKSDRTVELILDADLVSGNVYQLSIANIQDLAGNMMAPVSYTFAFGAPDDAVFKDVIITEIFADPSPPVSLPEVEYVEIYNRSNKALQLEGWTISDPSSKGTLGKHILQPHSYVILAGTGAEQFASSGDVIKVTGFPSLNNSDDVLTLRSATGTMIDSLAYGNWYRDSAKQSGGWSLELIDPENICAESENWAASESPAGGTPGQQNSILAEKPDLTGPQLVAALPVTADVIALRFNERLSREPVDASAFTFTNNLAAAEAHLDPDLRTIRITTTAPIERGILYRVSVQNVYDCPGNPVQAAFSAAEFAVPDEADSLDVVVNEILFNPRSGGVDFVEITNRSSKYLVLSSWQMGRMKDGVMSDVSAIPEHFRLLKPGEIRVFTPSAMTLESEYTNARGRDIVEMKVPPFNDDAGSVVIVNPKGRILDLFNYSEDMHSGFVRDPEGVSLERLSTERATNDPSNWKSASSHSGFATPGYENSNLVRESGNGDRVKVNPEAFVPIMGQPDFTIISYDLESPGMMGTVTIFDSRGRVVRRLTQYSVLGSNGFFRWDGETDAGGKARIGMYMIRFDIYDKTGLQESILKRVAIAGNY